MLPQLLPLQLRRGKLPRKQIVADLLLPCDHRRDARRLREGKVPRLVRVGLKVIKLVPAEALVDDEFVRVLDDERFLLDVIAGQPLHDASPLRRRLGEAHTVSLLGVLEVDEIEDGRQNVHAPCDPRSVEAPALERRAMEEQWNTKDLLVEGPAVTGHAMHGT